MEIVAGQLPVNIERLADFTWTIRQIMANHTVPIAYHLLLAFEWFDRPN